MICGGVMAAAGHQDKVGAAATGNLSGTLSAAICPASF